MTLKYALDLGAELTTVSREESGGKPFLYLTMDIKPFGAIITNAIDIIETKEFDIEDYYNSRIYFVVFDGDDEERYRIDAHALKILIKLEKYLESNLHKYPHEHEW